MPSPRLAVVHLLIATAAVVGLVGAAQTDLVATPVVAKCDFSTHEAMDPAAHGGMLMPTSAACLAYRPALNMARWSVRASTSVKKHPASAAVRGGTRTWWQSKSSRPGHFKPQTLTLRAKTLQLVSGLQYQPAKGRGGIGRFEVRLSTDGRHYGRVVATGRWQADSSVRQVGWNPTRIKAVRLSIRSVSPARSRYVTAADLVLTGVQPVTAPSSTPSSSAPTPQTPSAFPSTSVTTPSASASPKPTRSSAPTPSPTPSRPLDPALAGRWGPTIAFPLVPAAVAAIPGDRLVVWAAEKSMSFGEPAVGVTQTAILNLKTGQVTASQISNTDHDMFCPGVSMLADGRVLVTGGMSSGRTSIYDPATDSWSAGPEMNIGRGYQGQTTLSDGRAFTVGGSWSGALGGKLGEVWTPGGQWQVLPGVTTDPMVTADKGGIYRSDNHMWLIASSNGTVLQAGPSKQMNWISTSGDGATVPAGTRGAAGDQMNGNAVLFDVNKVLTVGGASSYKDVDATGAANVVDLSAGYGKTVSVSTTGALRHPRSFANSVVLPNGSVLTIGGMKHAVPFSDSGSVLTPELWNPATGTWTDMADEAEPRNYHSVAVLLPDGRVFSGGGGLCGACATNHPTGQIFFPPYLFNQDGSLATRPTISAAPTSVQPRDSITVSASADAASFVLVRSGESTHSVDNDQRRVPLSITSRNGGDVTLAVPSDTGVVLPGRWMLFAMSAAGVPSISAPISIGLGQ